MHNPYLGKPIFEGGQVDVEMFEFTYANVRTTSGEIAYQVPDQMNVPTVSFICETSDVTSEVTMSDSMESVSEEAKSSSFSMDNSISVDVSGFGNSFGASFEMGMS
jgi:hypothetical protein